jgi:endoglucanase
MYKITFLLLSICYSIFGQHNYPYAQHLSTRFLGAQRSGNTKSWIQNMQSKGAFVNDGQYLGKDLSGGWHDCGDYIKFHLTGPYTALMYLYGYFQFPEVYPDLYSADFSRAPGNGIPDVLDEVKIETDYLLKCLVGDTVFWQIGDGRDHDHFLEPTTQSNLKIYSETNYRAIYFTTEGKSNALGNAAAALALMGICYQYFDVNYARKCTEAAKKYYAIACINPVKTADARTEDGFYEWLGGQWSDCNDELGMGAALLFRVTKEQRYLDEAISWAKKANKWGDFGYGNVAHLLYYDLYLQTNRSDFLSNLKWRVKNYKTEPCGYTHISKWGSLRDAGNAAFISALYHKATGDSTSYILAKKNIDFILGSHNGISEHAPQNFSFLIGYNVLGGGFPQFPHHAPALGATKNAWDIYNTVKDKRDASLYQYQLTGGLAGGPEEACGKFEDDINNYISSEYCIYYNAAFTSAVAYINFQEKQYLNPNLNINIHQVRATLNGLKVQISISGNTQIEIWDKETKVWEGIVDAKKEITLKNNPKGNLLIKDKFANWQEEIILK